MSQFATLFALMKFPMPPFGGHHGFQFQIGSIAADLRWLSKKSELFAHKGSTIDKERVISD